MFGGWMESKREWGCLGKEGGARRRGGPEEGEKVESLSRGRGGLQGGSKTARGPEEGGGQGGGGGERGALIQCWVNEALPILLQRNSIRDPWHSLLLHGTSLHPYHLLAYLACHACTKCRIQIDSEACCTDGVHIAAGRCDKGCFGRDL